MFEIFLFGFLFLVLTVQAASAAVLGFVFRSRLPVLAGPWIAIASAMLAVEGPEALGKIGALEAWVPLLVATVVATFAFRKALEAPTPQELLGDIRTRAAATLRQYFLGAQPPSNWVLPAAPRPVRVEAPLVREEVVEEEVAHEEVVHVR